MPVISRDYWVSLFFGNTLYLVAFGYYFVITFLGYNGMLQLFDDSLKNDQADSSDSSSTLPASHGAFALPCTSTFVTVGGKSIRTESAQALCASVVGSGRLAEAGVAELKMYNTKVAFHLQ